LSSDRDEALLRRTVCRLDQQFDDRHVLEVADVRHLHFHQSHEVCLLVLVVCAAGSAWRDWSVGVDAVLRDSFRTLASGSLPSSPALQRRDDDSGELTSKWLAQLAAEVAAAVAVGAEHLVGAAARDERTDLSAKL